MQVMYTPAMDKTKGQLNSSPLVAPGVETVKYTILRLAREVANRFHEGENV